VVKCVCQEMVWQTMCVRRWCGKTCVSGDGVVKCVCQEMVWQTMCVVTFTLINMEYKG